jgi:ATP-binding cassette subfamily C (CFTR/MRP) protein 10
MELDREDDLERPLLRTVDDANVASHPSSKSPGDDVAARSPTQGGDGAGALSRLTFGWVSPLLQLGARTEQLHQSDLPDVPHNLLPAACAEELWLAWGREAARAAAAGRPPSLLRAVASAFGWQYLRLGGLKLVNDVLNFAGPIFLNGLLRYLSSGAAAAAAPGLHHQQPAFLALAGRHLDVGSPTFGTWCAGLLAASLLLKGLLNAHYNYSQGLVSNRLRAAVTCAVFRRTLELNAAALAGVGTGRVQTLMSVDADRLVGLCAGAHELWSLPLQIAAALWLLHTQVDFAFLAGLAIVLAIIPLNRLLAGAIQAASVRMMAAKDERVQVMGEALRGVRQIKAAAWEAAFAARAGAARERELGALAVRKYLDALCVVRRSTRRRGCTRACCARAPC